MISVKSTKGAVESADPAEPYARRTVAKPFGLAKAGAWLIAVAVYLKTALSGSVEAAAPAGAKEHREIKKEPRPVPDSKEEQSFPKETSPLPEKFDGHTVKTLLAADPNSDTIAFFTGEAKLDPAIFKPVAYVPSEANVNGFPNEHPLLSGHLRRVIDGDKAAPPKLRKPSKEEPVKTPQEVKGEDPAPAKESPPETEAPGGATENSTDDGEEGEGAKTSNRAPRVSGPLYLNDLSVCAILSLSLADLLRGATDPDGDQLHVENVSASSGHLTFHPDGYWEFETGGEVQPVVITYTISDGSLGVQQTLKFEVTPTHDILGTEGDDILIGTMCDDDIRALAGDDLIDARAGDDLIQGGAGDDHIFAGPGNDWVHGGPGHDIIFGGSGDDFLEGGRGNDRLFGESGDDELSGGEGDDHLDGGSGDDVLSGGQGNDRIIGNVGNDMIFGDAGDDTIDGGRGDDFVEGGAGNDVLRGGSGNDRMTGGDGNDHMVGGDGADILLGEAGDDLIEDGRGADIVNGGAGDDIVVATPDGATDHYDGGEGVDRIDYSAATEDLVIDLAAGRVTGVEIGQDFISNFEHVVAGAGDDLIRFGAQPVTVTGGAGQNRFEFATEDLWEDFFEGRFEAHRMEIHDFKVGDHLKLSKWDILHGNDDGPEDYEDVVFDARPSAVDIPIRYRSERTEEIDRTVLEADLDGDQFYEISFILNGHHSLIIQASAC
ncbi:cadherin-like domain-containing protein (plasmid) [Limimaricola variabilis]